VGHLQEVPFHQDVLQPLAQAGLQEPGHGLRRREAGALARREGNGGGARHAGHERARARACGDAADATGTTTDTVDTVDTTTATTATTATTSSTATRQVMRLLAPPVAAAGGVGRAGSAGGVRISTVGRERPLVEKHPGLEGVLDHQVARGAAAADAAAAAADAAAHAAAAARGLPRLDGQHAEVDQRLQDDVQVARLLPLDGEGLQESRSSSRQRAVREPSESR
jgi:hypothetical protein